MKALAAGVGLGLVVAFDVWLYRQLSGGRRRSAAAVDWSDPDNAPPAFDNYGGPHPFMRAPHTPCCAWCGGGRLNPVHPLGAGEGGPLAGTPETVEMCNGCKGLDGAHFDWCRTLIRKPDPVAGAGDGGPLGPLPGAVVLDGSGPHLAPGQSVGEFCDAYQKANM